MPFVFSPRLWLVAAAVLLPVAYAAPASSQEPQGPASVADVAEPLLGAVVNISTSQTVSSSRGALPNPRLPEGSPFQDFFDDFFNQERQGGEGNSPRRVQSLGSGFVIDPAGIIITNHHVIENADEIIANFADGQQLTATLLGRDEKTDIAVLQVSSDTPLPAVKFGDSDTIRVGDWVMAIGNPFGLGGTLTVGIVSARNRDINSGPYDDFIQTDAAINRGNSGGPLFNMQGEVVGINTAIISPTGGSIGIGFAVPAKIAENVIGQIREFGSTRRGWIGVRIQNVTDDLATALGLPEARGALVASVDEAGPADSAGVAAGDVVLSVDGQQIDRMNQLPRLVADLPVGATVSLVLLREGEERTVSVTLGRLEDAEADTALSASGDTAEGGPQADTQDAGRADADDGETDGSGPLGLDLAEMSPEVRSRFNIGAMVTGGVVITGVKIGSDAESKRLQAGDVLVEVGHEPVSSPTDVEARLEKMRAAKRTSVQLVVQNREGHVRWVNLPLNE